MNHDLILYHVLSPFHTEEVRTFAFPQERLVKDAIHKVIEVFQWPHDPSCLTLQAVGQPVSADRELSFKDNLYRMPGGSILKVVAGI